VWEGGGSSSADRRSSAGATVDYLCHLILLAGLLVESTAIGLTLRAYSIWLYNFTCNKLSGADADRSTYVVNLCEGFSAGERCLG
jgi:hypothetical protein